MMHPCLSPGKLVKALQALKPAVSNEDRRKSMTIARRDHALHMLFIRTPRSRTEPPCLQQSLILLVFLVGFLLFSLGACASGTSSTTVSPQSTVPATRYPSPTPTPLPAGSVLYQADWSHGLARWQGTQGWKVVQGQLETECGG